MRFEAVSFYASQDHYWDHLAPVAEIAGLDRVTRLSQASGTVVVAGFTDALEVATRPEVEAVVYVEHGAGQQYGGSYGYSGSPGVVKARGFICPNETVADRWRRRYRYAEVEAVGCPRLDRWHLARDASDRRTVAVTWHWPCRIHPMAGTALDAHRAVLGDAVDRWKSRGWTVLGHGHPKAGGYRDLWARLGVEWVSVDEVFERAAILVADNTSLLPEFMSLDRPVVFINDPAWDHGVQLGGRFWDWVAGGWQVSSPSDLSRIPLESLVDDDPYAEPRGEVVRSVYAHVDGKAAERAAELIGRVSRRYHGLQLR